MEQRITSETRDTVQTRAIERLSATAGNYGERVSGKFSTAYRTPEVVRNVISRNVQDRYFTGGVEDHRSDKGTLEIYYYRSPEGEVVFSRTEGPATKYLDERDEPGIREAEWYLCSMESRVTLLSNQGLIAASSHYGDYLGQPLARALPDQAESFTALHRGSGTYDDGETLAASYPIEISLPNTQWSPP